MRNELADLDTQLNSCDRSASRSAGRSGVTRCTPVLCGTPVSPPHRRRHWSRCSTERCGSFSRTTTIRCRSSEPDSTLEPRRDQLTERFFQRSVLPESSCLHYLLPDKRDPSVTDRLRHPRNFETLKSRTAKFLNSLIPHSLIHFLQA